MAEGPRIFKRDGICYLSTTEGGTDEGHQQWICRSPTGPFGPWEGGPKETVNPVLFNVNHPDVQNTGHMDLVEGADGSWWAVVLGIRPQGERSEVLSSLGRETFLAPGTWQVGWPIVNGGKKIDLLCQAEGLYCIEDIVMAGRLHW